jgi:saccharopine dehydrogenase (NAD+, L-glutamate forming)
MYDIVLFGATGFTGGLTAEYLRDHAPGNVSWAIAGRNREKLAALRERLGGVPALTADVDDQRSLMALAESARVVVTTVGPYIHYGEGLARACAETGTDYLDLTGEPEFVDLVYLRYHGRARATGARLVHCCGFDSIPVDLGVAFTVAQLPAGEPLHIDSYMQVRGMFSGGTFHSALAVATRMRQAAAVRRERRAAEPPVAGRRIHLEAGVPHRNRGLGVWAFPLQTIDPDVVRRSAGALERYGPDFSFSNYGAVRHLPTALGFGLGAAATFGLGQVPPVRKRLLARFPSGQGPSEERRANSWFTVHLRGEGGGRQVITKVAGGDPGYGETSKMLGESALCLAFDDVPATPGQSTPAAAMGDHLIGRLRRAGITFTRLAESPS